MKFFDRLLKKDKVSKTTPIAPVNKTAHFGVPRTTSPSKLKKVARKHKQSLSKASRRKNR